ncbi:hypothetical protein ABPG74_010474 [Tetrahymena malaccensis]
MFPIMLFGYTYYKYRAVITKDLMHSLQPIMEQYEKKKKIQQEFFHGQNQKQLQRRNGGEFQQNQQDQILQNGEYLIENELVKDAEKFQNQINNKKRLTSQLNDRKNSYIDGVQMGQIVTVTEKDDIEKQQPNQKQKETKNIFLPEQKVNDNQQNEMSESQKIFNQMKSSMNQERKCSNIQKPLIEEENQQIDDIRQNQNVTNNQLDHVQKKDNQARQELFNIRKSQTQPKIDGTQNKNELNEIKKIKNKEKNDMSTENSLYFGINLLIDANIVPNLQTLLFDQNLQKFYLISDIQEAIFESLPIAIIQYINNTQNNSWQNSNGSINFLLYLVFCSQCLSLVLHFISLINLLYDKDIQIFTKVLDYLNESNPQSLNQTNLNDQLVLQQDQKGDLLPQINQLPPLKLINNRIIQKRQRSKTNFGDIFPMRKSVEIDQIEQLDKLVRLTEAASKKIKKLTVVLSNNTFSKNQIQENLVQCFQKFSNISFLSLNLEGNQMGDQIFELLLRGIFKHLLNLKNLRLGNKLTKNSVLLLKRMVLSWEHQLKGKNSRLIIAEDLFLFKKKDYQEISQLDETKDISLELNNSKICSDKNKQQTQHDEQESLENDELLIQSLNKIMKGRVHQEMSFFEIQQKQFVTDQELLMISKCLKHLNKLSHVELILNSNIQQNFEDYQNLITQVNNSISDTVALCFFSIKYKINQHKFIKNTFLSQKILKQKGLSITQQQECIYGQQFYWENQGFNQKLCTFAINNIIDTFSMYTSYESLLLNFNRNKARDQNIFKIADNIKNIPLSQLGLQFANSRFTQKGFQCLSELISNQKILEDFTFEISQNEMTKSDCKSISKSIQELQGLKKLQIILNQNKILNEGLQLILEVLSSLNSELADFKLDLSANTMNLETCNQLSKLLSSQKQMKNLEIIVQFNNIQSEGLHKIIQSIPSLENIQSLALDLKGNNLDSNGMTYLSEHLKFAKLLKQIKLDLSQNEQIGDQGIANLSSAFQCLDLLLSIQINLRKCSITHQGIICLVDNVDEKNNLESFSIDIQENMLEESTENKLSAIRHLTSYISKQNDKLQNLELYFNNLDLSENCILCISGMLDFLPQLQKLQIDLRGNKVEEKQKRFLFRSLAGLKSENPYVMISI